MITVTRMRKMDTGNVKAYFDATINGVEIKGLKLVTSKEDGSMFLSFPSEKGKDEKYYNIVFISDMILKQEVEDTFIAAYTNVRTQSDNAERQ